LGSSPPPDTEPDHGGTWAPGVRGAGCLDARIRGKSRMREYLTYGSARGAPSNRCPYRDQLAQPKKPRHDELKGLVELTGHVFSERWTTFSGFAGPPKRDDADLLIQQGLLAKAPG